MFKRPSASAGPLFQFLLVANTFAMALFWHRGESEKLTGPDLSLWPGLW